MMIKHMHLSNVPQHLLLLMTGMTGSNESKWKIRRQGEAVGRWWLPGTKAVPCSCWQGCFPPRRKDPGNNQAADGEKGFWLLLVWPSSYELSPCPEKAVPGQVTMWSSARADVRRLQRTWPSLCRPVWFSVSLGERRRIDKEKPRKTWHIDSFPCPDLYPRALCCLPSPGPNYTPSKMMNTGRADHISVKINGKPSLVPDQASVREMLLVNKESWWEKETQLLKNPLRWSAFKFSPSGTFDPM